MEYLNITNVRSYGTSTNESGGEQIIQLTGCLGATIDGIEMSVPLDPANRHYAEILRQVEAGTLVVLAAETPEL